ncbi:MAG: hypothetical protein MJ252_16050 [archaeon]|nr:hypothetical protein [archaeon]
MSSIIEVDVPTFAEQYVNNASETFYKINLFNKYSGKKWSLSKTFKEFEDLEAELKTQISCVPSISGKSMFKVKAYDLLKERQTHILQFLIDCIGRKDIFSTDSLIDFLMLRENAPELLMEKEKKLNQSEQFPFAIKKFFFVKSEGIIFIICSEMNLTNRVDAYFTNLTLPWEEKNEVEKCTGAFMVYKINFSEKKGYVFEKVFVKTFPNIPTTFTYDEVSKIVAIGFNSGDTLLFKNYDENTLAGNFEQFGDFNHHRRDVTGIGIDFRSGYIYTCGIDKDFIGAEINKFDNFEVINSSEYLYTHMIMDVIGGRIFLAIKLSGIEIYSTHTYPPVLVADVESSCDDVFMDLIIDYNRCYIFACALNWNIYVFKLGEKDKEKNTKEISAFPATCCCQTLAYDPNCNELIIGDIYGKITVLNLKTAQPLKVFDAHSAGISCFYYNKDKRLLVAGGEDNIISVWQLPKKWMNEDVKRFEQEEALIASDTQAMLRLQKSLERGDDYNSDEDSINGWDFLPEDEL